jgi:hypothetical protein
VSTPEPGQNVEITIRGRVLKVACRGYAVLIHRPDGYQQWIDLPGDVLESVTWRTCED